MITRRVSTASAVVWLSLCALPVISAAQAYRPVVNMSITLPDGATKQVTAPESGLATVTVKEGQEYGFRPTMLDDEGSRIVITVFDMGTPTSAVRELGEVEVKGGGGDVQTKTSPAFKVRASRGAATT